MINDEQAQAARGTAMAREMEMLQSEVRRLTRHLQESERSLRAMRELNRQLDQNANQNRVGSNEGENANSGCQ